VVDLPVQYGGEFIDELSNYELLKKGLVPCSLLDAKPA
jgi:hypothetical protein